MEEKTGIIKAQPTFCGQLAKIKQEKAENWQLAKVVRSNTILSVDLATAMSGKQIAVIKNDEELNISLLELLEFVEDNLNVKTKLTEPQKATVVAGIKKEYSSMRPEEVALAFKNGVMGKYPVNDKGGTHFMSIDVPFIFNWLNKFLESDERIGYFESKNQKHKTEEKKEGVDYKAIASENAKKIFDEIGDNTQKDDFYRRWDKERGLREKINRDSEKRNG